MPIHQEDVDLVKNMLWEGEKVIMTAQQRRVGPGADLINPSSVIATDQRLILVNKQALGLRKDFESIPYKQITSVRLENGIISASIFIRVQGYDRDEGFLKAGDNEGEIDGIRKNDAKELADYVSKMIMGTPSAMSQNSEGVFCPKCGVKNSIGAKFCTSCGAKL